MNFSAINTGGDGLVGYVKNLEVEDDTRNRDNKDVSGKDV